MPLWRVQGQKGGGNKLKTGHVRGKKFWVHLLVFQLGGWHNHKMKLWSGKIRQRPRSSPISAFETKICEKKQKAFLTGLEWMLNMHGLLKRFLVSCFDIMRHSMQLEPTAAKKTKSQLSDIFILSTAMLMSTTLVASWKKNNKLI